MHAHPSRPDTPTPIRKNNNKPGRGAGLTLKYSLEDSFASHHTGACITTGTAENEGISGFSPYVRYVGVSVNPVPDTGANSGGLGSQIRMNY